MDNEKFRQYILPLLLTAHAKGDKVRIEVSGCEGVYPKILSVDSPPRK